MNKEFKHKGTGEVVKKYEHDERFYEDEDGCMYPSRFVENSLDWEEIKESLYTTYDGVERFEFQREHWVIYDEYIPSHNFTICEAHLVGSLTKPDTFKIFSTEEKAQEYALGFKPCLSLNDLLSVWGNKNEDFDVYSKSLLFQRFKQLAKTK